ncbi:unnamed protein product [Moneuplotes crassus]|uniref:Uncharacterized protein n=1 Tax=Euplotes crassus TaxID=5936 RepID=A0AAD1XK91_EUPCR|nr:unnamed protein product [Moneuplotes crassus]
MITTVKDIGASTNPSHRRKKSSKVKPKKGVGSPKRNNRKQKKRGTVQNYVNPNRLVDEQMSFERLAIDPSLNSIKQDILDCLKMLTKEYLSHNESQKLGYFNYLLYFAVTQREDLKHKIMDGIVFCKILKQVDHSFNKEVFKRIECPPGITEEDKNLYVYLQGLKALDYPSHFIPEVMELKKMSKSRFVEHIFKLYDFVKRRINSSPNETKKLPDLAYGRILRGSHERELLKLLEAAHKVIEKKKRVIQTQSDQIQTMETEIHNLRTTMIQNATKPKPLETIGMLNDQQRKYSDIEGPMKQNNRTGKLVRNMSFNNANKQTPGNSSDIVLLQDDNEDLKNENEDLLKEINNITFQFESEIEQLTIANKNLSARLDEKTSALQKALESNNTLKEKIEELQIKIMSLEPEKPLMLHGQKDNVKSINSLYKNQIEESESASSFNSEKSQENVENINLTKKSKNFPLRMEENLAQNPQTSPAISPKAGKMKVLNKLDTIMMNNDDDEFSPKRLKLQRHRSYFLKKPLRVVKADSGERIKEIDELIHFIECGISDHGSEEDSNLTDKDSKSDLSFFGISVGDDQDKALRKMTKSGEFQITDSENDDSLFQE